MAQAFFGGVHPHDMKAATNEKAIEQLAPPAEVVIPMPSLYTALGIYLPLITTNCAVLGVALLNIQSNFNFIESVVYGITGGLGFLLAIVLFASVRERNVFADCPKCFEGFPIALVTAGLMALSFMQRLKESAEKAKIELSGVTTSNINLPYITADANGPKHLDVTLTRAKFNELTSHLVDATMADLS